MVDQNIHSANFHFKTIILRAIITNPDKLESIVLQTPLRSGDLLADELSRISVTPSLSWSVCNNAEAWRRIKRLQWDTHLLQSKFN